MFNIVYTCNFPYNNSHL